MSQPIDIINSYFVSNGMESSVPTIIEKLNDVVANCTKVGDSTYNDFTKYINSLIKRKDWSKQFYSQFFPSLRSFLKSSNPHFSVAMLDGTSSGDTSQGESKKFRFQAKKGFFTYICKDFPLTKEDVLNAFLNNPKFGYKIEKAIACN